MSEEEKLDMENPYSDEAVALKVQQSRCNHIFIKGKSKGCQCMIKKKEGYQNCYAHLTKNERDQYDLERLRNKGLPTGEIEQYFLTKRALRNKVSRESARKIRALNQTMQTVLTFD